MILGRTWISALAGLALVSLAWPLAAADAQVKRHGVSLIGEPKVPADYKHFEFANPDAPKGGALRMSETGTFDSLNPFTIKGVAAEGIGLIYDSLMFSSPDEPSAEYGLVAEWISYPDDYSSVTFGLRPEAKFHDGKPVTPDDIIFSFEQQKKNSPAAAFYYKNVVKAEKTAEREVTFTFDTKGNRELPQIVGQINVLPKLFWDQKGANGEPRDLAKSTLEIPLGSGPYKIKSVDAGRGIVFERVKDWWAKDLPVGRGLYNFDEISYIYFKDRLPAFEGFKSGVFDYWVESKASDWATGYEFDAVKKGLVKKENLAHSRVAPMQALVYNLRRPQFQDIRVRRALAQAFNFEALNKSIFYGQYIRTQSYFGNSELAATGLPEGRELEILTELKADLPPEVFTTPWKSPSNEKDADFRINMLAATKLLDEAGWKVDGRVRKNAAGETLKLEVLLERDDFERIVLPFVDNLKKLGVEASVRLVDAAQYKRRLDSRDYDIFVGGFAQSLSPGNEQRQFFGSEAADREGSPNTIGIKSPVVDKLVDKVVFTKDRADLVAATKALDRALLWNWYLIPQWYYPYDRVATWDIYGRPEKLPSQNPAYVSSWWADSGKQQAVAAAKGK